jgi:hypothetical protein
MTSGPVYKLIIAIFARLFPRLLPGLLSLSKAAECKITIAQISGKQAQNSLVTPVFSAHPAILAVFSLMGI